MDRVHLRYIGMILGTIPTRFLSTGWLPRQLADTTKFLMRASPTVPPAYGVHGPSLRPRVPRYSVLLPIFEVSLPPFFEDKDPSCPLHCFD